MPVTFVAGTPYERSTSATFVDVTGRPAVAAGSHFLAVLAHRGKPYATGPAGWTKLHDIAPATGSTQVRLELWLKLAADIAAEASEPTTYSWSGGDSSKVAASIWRVDGAKPDLPSVDAYAEVVSSGSTTVNTAIVTAQNAGAAFHCAQPPQISEQTEGAVNFYTPGTGLTEVLERATTPSNGILYFVGTESLSAAGQTTQRSWTKSSGTSGSGNSVSISVAFVDVTLVDPPVVTYPTEFNAPVYVAATVGQAVSITMTATNSPTSWEWSLWQYNGADPPTDTPAVRASGIPLPTLTNANTATVSFTAPSEVTAFTLLAKATNSGGTSVTPKFVHVIVAEA